MIELFEKHDIHLTQRGENVMIGLAAVAGLAYVGLIVTLFAVISDLLGVTP